MPRVLRRLNRAPVGRAAAILLALLVVACLPNGGRWQVTLPGALDGAPALPVMLDDRTGLVTGIGPPPIADDVGIPEGVSNLPGCPEVLIVHWVTGACTEATHMQLASAGGRYRLTLSVIDRPGACVDIGIGRLLAVSLAAPVDARGVELLRGRQ